jgi:hypothetical protein
VFSMMDSSLSALGKLNNSTLNLLSPLPTYLSEQ